MTDKIYLIKTEIVIDTEVKYIVSNISYKNISKRNFVSTNDEIINSLSYNLISEYSLLDNIEYEIDLVVEKESYKSKIIELDDIDQLKGFLIALNLDINSILYNFRI